MTRSRQEEELGALLSLLVGWSEIRSQRQINRERINVPDKNVLESVSRWLSCERRIFFILLENMNNDSASWEPSGFHSADDVFCLCLLWQG